MVEADYLNHEFTPDFGLGSLDNTIIADLPRSTFQGVSWQYNKAKQATATASLKHKINNSWNLNLTGSYQSYDRDYYSLEQNSGCRQWRLATAVEQNFIDGKLLFRTGRHHREI